MAKEIIPSMMDIPPIPVAAPGGLAGGPPEELVRVAMYGQMVTMPRSLAALANQKVTLKVDSQTIEIRRVSLSQDPKGKPIPRLTTIYDAAGQVYVPRIQRNPIPILCHREYMTPVAVCRVCSVEVRNRDGKAEGRLAPACSRPVEDGMEVLTHKTSPRVRAAVKMLTELLLADHPLPCAKQQRDGDCELELLALRFQVGPPRFSRAHERRVLDETSLVIAVDHNACILCDRCIRGCNDIRDNQVIGRAGKGYQATIAFDLNTGMGNSTCVACGECMVSCPTGALLNRKEVQARPWEGLPAVEPVSADALAGHPLFEGVSHPFLRWNEGAVVRRRFRKGDVICREGQFGSTAFYIEEGKVEVSIQAPLRHVKGLKNPRRDQINRGPLGLVRRFACALVSRAEDVREEESTTHYIPIDAPVALKFDNPNDRPVAELEKGEIFGEMTCMNNYPRAATVTALTDCTVLEMLRNVLYILQRNKKSRALLEARYRRRAIDSHLRSVPIFADLLRDERLFEAFVNFLRDRVSLIRLNPGDIIFRQGDPADSFYLVRIGFVKVAQQMPGGEHVLSYVGPGKYFGEIGLMNHIPEVRALAPEGVRTATCSALDHVDLVRITGDDFRAILENFPQVRAQLVGLARQRLEENEAARQRAQTVPLGDFLAQGLMNAQSLLVLDLERCTRCDECTKACADAHDGVTRLIREGLRFDKYLVASSCRSCLDPYCMVGCPVGSIRRRNSREIIIEDWCIGCGKCAENCPYGNINMHPFPTGQQAPDPADSARLMPVFQQKATTCDLCSELKDQQPSCVYACPHDAAFRWTGDEFRRRVQAR